MSPITLQLTGIAHGGEAFGRHESKIVFTPYAIPGETVQVEVITEKTRWMRARLSQVLTPSPDRIEAPCPYFGPGACSGCQWQHISYERQLALKRDIVADQLHRLGRIADPPLLDPIALADDAGLLTFHYRNQTQFMTDSQGRFSYSRAVGESEEGQQQEEVSAPEQEAVIAIEACLLLHPLLDEVHSALVEGGSEANAATEASASDEDAPAANGPDSPAVIKRLGLRAGVNTGQRLLAFETRGDRAPGFAVEDLPVRCVLRRRDGALQGLIGEPWIEEVIAGRTFRISPGSPFPANTVGAEVLVALAGELLAPAGHETLLDAYCGVGLFGLSLVQQVGQVLAIEESEEGCEDFAWNAGLLDNVALFEGPVAKVLAALDETERPDLALISPPRSGAGLDVARHLARLRVRRLLYVSDDPATLARDARLLAEAGYGLRQVQPVDLAPQTRYITCLALFELGVV